MAKEASKQSKGINPNYRLQRKSGALPDAEALFQQLREGDRNALARAITYVESSLAAHRPIADALVNASLPYAGRSRRIAITGSPGVGKSSFIEALGSWLLSQEKKLAVLAIDPSSQRTGGSILGDKTRMQKLAVHPQVFVRPSPAGETLGGVAQRTRESMLLCEAAGYDTIFIETVGVGQSEHTVSHICDLFLLLLLPGAGDELQGIKRGIVEMADLLFINKADGPRQKIAKQTQRAYRNALHLYPANDFGWSAKVLIGSATEGLGIDKLWEQVEGYYTYMQQDNRLAKKRQQQAIHWFQDHINQLLRQGFDDNERIQSELPAMLSAIHQNKISPFAAAKKLIEKMY